MVVAPYGQDNHSSPERGEDQSQDQRLSNVLFCYVFLVRRYFYTKGRGSSAKLHSGHINIF